MEMAGCHHPGQAEACLLPRLACPEREKGLKGETSSRGQGTHWALTASSHSEAGFQVIVSMLRVRPVAQRDLRYLVISTE